MKIFNELRKKVIQQKENDELYELYASPQGAFDDVVEMINNAETSFKVMREQVLISLLNGEWVKTQDIEEYLGIKFSQGIKLFDFSRTAEWNPPPLNGQKITTKFKLKAPKTNADRIRAMTDEELAKIIMCPYDTAGDPVDIMPCVQELGQNEFASPEYCHNCMMNWLKRKVGD